MTTGEIMSLATIVGVVLSFLGVTQIDSSVISSAITGIIALVTIGASVWAAISHHNVVVAGRAAGVL